MEADHSLKGFSSMLCAHGALSCMMLSPQFCQFYPKPTPERVMLSFPRPQCSPSLAAAFLQVS